MLQPRTCAAILRKVTLTMGLALTAGAGCHSKGASSDTTALSASRTPTQVVDAVTRTVEKWRQAWEVRDLETIAPSYSHDLDLVVVVQGQPYLGWSAVETYLSTKINEAQSIHITLADLQVVALDDGAATASATMTREFSDGVTTVTERGVVTMALRAQSADGDWVIVAEHYSYPPSFQ